MEYKLANNNRIAVFRLGFKTGTSKETLPFTEKIETILREESPAFILINLSDLSFIDSNFLGALVKALKITMKENVELVLTDLEKPVRSMFELTKLYNIFTIYQTEQEALSALSE